MINNNKNGAEETFGGDGYVYDLCGGNSFMGVYTH